MNKPSDKHFDGKAFARRLTTAPGVYRMNSADGTALYVGKAHNLRKRVSSYFSRAAMNARTQTMLTQVESIEISVTRTEGEALLLENQLIKELKPRYNVLLRDDKSYPFIYLSAEDDFPRLAFHRGPRRLPGEYFGPFPSAYAVRDSLNQMQKLFRVRQCEDSFFRNRSRPCLQYQIKRCTAPCVELIDAAAYAADVRHARLFLRGKSYQVIRELGAQMEAASGVLEFERAAAIRDQIANLKRIQAQQYVAGSHGNLDIVAVAGQGAAVCVQVFFFREGRNVGNRAFFPRNHGDAGRAEVLGAFIAQYYSERDPPAQIVASLDFPDRSLLEAVLGERLKKRIRILYRPRGEKAKWLQIAINNAQTALASQLKGKAGMQRRVSALKELLGLDEPPQRMECFDISHTRGEATVASCVVFDANGPVKSDYRRFNIGGITPGDDYAAIHQALERRYRRLKAGEGSIPDVLFIDGGKGQLGHALAVLEELQIDQVLVVAVAKGSQRKAGHETLFVGPRQTPLQPPPDSLASHLIQSIRDEAHRFAITAHRQRRGKARQRSMLEDIPGIGAKRRRHLLKHFGGLQGLRRAGVEELCAVEGIHAHLAQRIYDALHD